LIDLTAIREAFEKLAGRHASVLVEGAGGIAVPISAQYDFRDLARDLRLSVILVSANRLGVLNHTRLTVEAVRAAGLTCSLIALNSVQADADLSQTTNLSVLENVVDVPVLEVEHDQDDFSDLVERLL
jgi:dethiobiotin synthetase